VAGLLNDLTREVAILAAARGFTVAVRLCRGNDGGSVELKACKESEGGLCEYLRNLSVHELELRGAEEVANEFVREARLAFSGQANLTIQRSPLRSVR